MSLCQKTLTSFQKLFVRTTAPIASTMLPSASAPSLASPPSRPLSPLPPRLSTATMVITTITTTTATRCRRAPTRFHVSAYFRPLSSRYRCGCAAANPRRTSMAHTAVLFSASRRTISSTQRSGSGQNCLSGLGKTRTAPRPLTRILRVVSQLLPPPTVKQFTRDLVVRIPPLPMRME